MRGVPLPTIGFQVTEARFLPITNGILARERCRVVSNQTPIIDIADGPHDQHRCVEPTVFLKDLPFATPLLAGGIDQMLEGAFVSGVPQDNAFLDAKQIVLA